MPFSDNSLEVQIARLDERLKGMSTALEGMNAIMQSWTEQQILMQEQMKSLPKLSDRLSKVETRVNRVYWFAGAVGAALGFLSPYVPDFLKKLLS